MQREVDSVCSELVSSNMSRVVSGRRIPRNTTSDTNNHSTVSANLKRDEVRPPCWSCVLPCKRGTARLGVGKPSPFPISL